MGAGVLLQAMVPIMLPAFDGTKPFWTAKLWGAKCDGSAVGVLSVPFAKQGTCIPAMKGPDMPAF